MSEDPLRLGGLDPEVLEPVIESRKKGTKKDSYATVLRAETAAKKEERMQQTQAAPTAPPPPPPPPEPVVDKSRVLDKIQAYRERFTHLKSRNKVSAKSTSDELLDELHYLEQQLGQKEGHMGTQMFMLALTGVEEATKYYNPLGLNLTGLSKVAQDNQDQFTPILDELFIKYAMNMYVGPEMRLVMATATLMYTVHSANNGNPQVARAMEAMSRQAPTPPPSAKDL
ncbi:MAG: hypothetical protein CMO41_04485 [Verrucomicrobiales bacterium]|nr:hypothetical protein [Verrucomicrobiales bacterium]|tara:strand:- start:10558 stop:11238 length:681 start_codon:yes stop_codon:yes gene_type:complete